MQVIKKVNNNIAICLDNNNKELIAIGKGIGYPKTPYKIDDLSKIERTFYDIEPSYLELINTIPEQVMNVSIKVVDMVRTNIDKPISSNLVFTLADHINFTIKLVKKGMILPAPLKYDIQNLYPKEYELGEKALHIISKDLSVLLPRDEACNIALHFINAQAIDTSSHNNDHIIISDIVDIVSRYFKLYIDKTGFNYSRFVTHLQYLLKNKGDHKNISSVNKSMFKSVTKEYPDTFKCVEKISDYLTHQDIVLSDEEKLYLILHINRLRSW